MALAPPYGGLIVNISFDTDLHVAIDLSKADLQTIIDMANCASASYPEHQNWKRILEKLKGVLKE